MAEPLRHVYQVETYRKPTRCAVCNKLLLGIVKQGRRCQQCGINVHNKCANAAQIAVLCEAPGSPPQPPASPSVPALPVAASEQAPAPAVNVAVDHEDGVGILAEDQGQDVTVGEMDEEEEEGDTSKQQQQDQQDQQPLQPLLQQHDGLTRSPRSPPPPPPVSSSISSGDAGRPSPPSPTRPSPPGPRRERPRPPPPPPPPKPSAAALAEEAAPAEQRPPTPPRPSSFRHMPQTAQAQQQPEAGKLAAPGPESDDAPTNDEATEDDEDDESGAESLGDAILASDEHSGPSFGTLRVQVVETAQVEVPTRLSARRRLHNGNLRAAAYTLTFLGQQERFPAGDETELARPGSPDTAFSDDEGGDAEESGGAPAALHAEARPNFRRALNSIRMKGSAAIASSNAALKQGLAASRSKAAGVTGGKVLSPTHEDTAHDVWDTGAICEFEVRDVSADLRLVVFRTQVMSRKAIGQVMVPLASVVASAGTLDQWFELFPVPAGAGAGGKFRPAAPVIAKSGMGLPKNSIGYVRLRCTLQLQIPRSALWRKYYAPLDPSVRAALEPRRGNLWTNLRELRRSHVRAQVVRDFVAQHLVRPPQTTLEAVRSWRRPMHSAGMCAAACMVILFVRIWHLPLVAYGALAVYSYTTLSDAPLRMNWASVPRRQRSRNASSASVTSPEAPVTPVTADAGVAAVKDSHELYASRPEGEIFFARGKAVPPDHFLIWNEQVRDSKGELNIFRKGAKASASMATEIGWLRDTSGHIVSCAEKTVNVLTLADQDASAAVHALLAVGAAASSAALLFHSLFPWTSRLALCAALVAYCAPPEVRNAAAAAKPQPSGGGIAGLSLVDALRNAFARVPDLDELGHRHIAQHQCVERQHAAVPGATSEAAGGSSSDLRRRKPSLVLTPPVL